eukprot:1152366-Pelagomonas_calceolata.AAC.2
MITPYQAKPASSSSSSSSSCSHYALCNRHNPTQRTSGADRVRQPHQQNANQQHVHLIEIKYREDTGPEQQLEAAQRQHTNLCNLISAKSVTLHMILLGAVGIVILSTPLTSLSSWTINVSLNLLKNLCPFGSACPLLV